MKHGSGKPNRVVDAPSRRQLLLTEMEIELVGFKEISTLHVDDPNFSEGWKAFTEPITLDRTKWLDFMIQIVGFLKKANCAFPKVQ